MDIRDLVIEEDLFDPFDEEDEQAPEVAGEIEPDDTPLIGEAMEESPAPKVDMRPPRQRIYELLGQMPGQKRLLLSIVDYCREEKTGEEMDAFTEELQVNNYSVYTPVILRELLEKAGAIRYEVEESALEAEEAPSGVVEGDAGADAPDDWAAAGQTESASAAEVLTLGDDCVDGGGRSATESGIEESRVPGNAFVAAAAGAGSAVGSEVLHEQWESGEDTIDIEYLEVADMPPGVWVATEEGIEIVDEQDDYGAIKRLLGKEPKYQDIYQRILDFCKDEGRSAKELDNLVNDDPLLEEPRRYSGYFVGRLEREGAIQWANGWVLTKDGAKMLQTLIEEAAAAVQAYEEEDPWPSN